MLSKLFYYECRSAGRLLVPLWCGSAAFCLVAALVSALAPGSLAEVLCTFVAVLALAAQVAASCVLALWRFYLLLGESGYWWFSLPATAGQHLAARLSAAAGSILLSLGVFFLDIVLLFAHNVSGFAAELTDVFKSLAAGWPVFVLMLLGVVFTLLFFYLCFCIGGHWPQQRLLASVIAYFVLGFVGQIAMVLLLLLAAVLMAPETAVLHPVWVFLLANVKLIPLICCLLFAVLDVILFVVVRYWLDRRLNLP